MHVPLPTQVYETGTVSQVSLLLGYEIITAIPLEHVTACYKSSFVFRMNKVEYPCSGIIPAKYSPI